MSKARRRTNANTLSAYWSKKEKDVWVRWPDQKSDGHYLHAMLGRQPRTVEDGKVVYGKSFLEELKDRGYDITTLRFSVMKQEK